MTFDTNYRETDNLKQAVIYFTGATIEVGTSAGIGYLLSWSVSFNPIHGAIFAGVNCIVSRVIDFAMDYFFAGLEASNEVKFLGKVVSIVLSTAITAGLALLIGFPIGIEATLLMGGALLLGILAAKIIIVIGKTLVMVSS